MSAITEFYRKVSGDEALTKELAEIMKGTEFADATDEQLLQVGAMAKRLGMEISLEEAKEYFSSDDMELDEEDMDSVAGGKGTSVISVYRGDDLRGQWVNGQRVQ